MIILDTLLPSIKMEASLLRVAMVETLPLVVLISPTLEK